MEAYAETLRSAGAIVEWVRADGMDCVLKSQLVRMLAFTSTDVIHPEDLVMTVDVNAFPMNARFKFMNLFEVIIFHNQSFSFNNLC